MSPEDPLLLTSLPSHLRDAVINEVRTLPDVSDDEARGRLALLHGRIAAEAAEETRLQQLSSHVSQVGGARGTFRWQIWRGLALVAGVAVVLSMGKTLLSPSSSPTLPGESTYTTGRGERATVMLPDGSTVLLNVASRLDIPEDYASGNRRVRLDGEALFSVESKADMPFVVTTGDDATRVLGTVFGVRRYGTDTATVVAVREGRVAVQQTVIAANQEVQIQNRTVSPVQSAHAARFSFATGVLELTGMTLGAAIPELNRWYNADIRVVDQNLRNRRVAGGFVEGSLDALEEILSLMFNCRVERDGHVLTLSPK